MSGHEDRTRMAVGLLGEVAANLRTRIERVLRAREISYDQWRVLDSLVDAGPQTMRLLGRSTRITGPTLTRVVDRLTESALVYRNVDAEDRRRVVVHLSARGRRLVDDLHPQVAELEREALAPLSADEAELLGRLLERLTVAHS